MFLERILTEISKKGITKNKMLSDLGINHNAFAKWENPNSTPRGETLAKIAEYFNVTTDYLLGRTSNKTEDIASGLEALVRELELAQDGLMFNGQPLDQETKEILISNLEHTIEMGKKFALTGQPKTTEIIAELQEKMDKQ